MPGLEELIGILDLEPIERNLFRGGHPADRWQRVFGGQVVAQALAAAYRTIEDRPVHSLHAYFIRPGDPEIPIIYDVDRLRDGKSFSVRRVLAVQHGEPIFSMGCSFQVPESGLEHQLPMPDVPAPEDVPSEADLRRRFGAIIPPTMKRFLTLGRPIELRPVDPEGMLTRKMNGPSRYFWLRAGAGLPDEPRLHDCVLAYVSDMTLLDTSLMVHGRSLFEGGFQTASLDHALWFHRPFRIDDWLLYAQDSPNAAGGRGFNRGSFFKRDGTLVASVAQEGLIRERHA